MGFSVLVILWHKFHVFQSLQLNDTDPDGDPLTTSILTGPAGGMANVLNGDSIQYTPDSGFTGADTITYQVCDIGKQPLCCDQAMVVITVTSVVGIADITDDPRFKVFPNPFNTETKINYSLKKAGFVTITIYNRLGQPVRHLVQKQKPAGQYTVLWDGRNDKGVLIPDGVYFHRLQTDKFVRANKLILVR